MSKWVGYAVSVNCGEPLGCYQGTIIDADGSTITLTKAFRNGFPYPKSKVTLNAADIKELKIIETRAQPAEQTHSTVAVAKAGKRAPRATVCENLQANPSSSGNVSQSNVPSNKASARGNQAPARSKPIEIQSNRINKNNNHTGSYGQGGSTPKARGAGGGGGGGGGAGLRRRDEAAFGSLADPALDRDFDFEGNLALFDKQALWEQMNNQKPDLVRQTDEAGKFRHDENVLGGGGAGAAARRPVAVPDALRGPGAYVTDDGVLLPSVDPATRARLWEAMERVGLGDQARVLLARATADVCVRLVGGGRRLEPRNAHQAPAVAALCGAHAAGGAGLLAARLLHSHNARVTCYVHPPSALREGGGGGGAGGGGGGAGGALAGELAALRLSGAALAGRLDQLPRADLLLLALHDPADLRPQHDLYESIWSWVAQSRVACVVMEPGPECGGAAAGALVRASVQALLPGWGAPGGRLYLADVAPPARLLAELGVRYRPPFGAAPLLALHPDAD